MSIERVDPTLCNGCRLCVDTCPMDCFRLDTLVNDRGEYPPCRMSCPLGVDMRRYIYLLRDGSVEEAIKVLRESLPLPAITGRICPHPCESECARKEVDEAVNINSLERYVADLLLKEKAAQVHIIYSSKVALIGAGPAGLACAYFLARKGYPVTIIESMAEPGGMLRYGIPEFRLPKDVLAAQINNIKDMGINFKLNTTVGQDIALDKLVKEYQAVFIATGSNLSSKIQIEGTELKGVMWGLEFLREVNQGKFETAKGQKAVVIGGGNVAIDAAMTVSRLGAGDVQLVCLESKEKMPAYEEEIRQALEEGISINASWGPSKIIGLNNTVRGVELIKCSRLIDESGKFNPCYDEKQTRSIDADIVIVAIGQEPDLSFLSGVLNTSGAKTVQVDPLTMETGYPGIFAGGDVVTGSSTVVESMAAGKRAADSIERYLKFENIREGRNIKPNRVKHPPKEGVMVMPRQVTHLLPVGQRAGNFKEVKLGFNADTVRLESQRCMTCGSRAVIAYPEDCQLCLFCERDCPVKAIYVSPDKKELPMMAWR